MRYLDKIVFINSAHIPYAEIKVDGNVHFIGTQGVGKSTILRAILFFYNADKMHLGIPKEKKNFDSFYLPYPNSYIIYEVMRENGAYCVMLTKTMGRAAFRFIDAPYSRRWFVDDNNIVAADWSEVRRRIPGTCQTSRLITDYYMFRDIIFGNNHKPELMSFRKYAIVESVRYQNIPRTIQNVFLNSKLDADFIKNTIIQSMTDEDICIDLDVYRSLISSFEQEYNDVMLWIKPNKNGVVLVKRDAARVMERYRDLLYLKEQVFSARKELNYAGKQAENTVPVLNEEISGLQQKKSRFLRLISEEKQKHDSERTKLLKEIGIIDDKLKSIRSKYLYYRQQNITDVMRRVSCEASLKNELESYKDTYMELTAQNKDIIGKYDELIRLNDLKFQDFVNQKNAEITSLGSSLNNRKNEIIKAAGTSHNQHRQTYDERRETYGSRLIELNGELSDLRHKRSSLRNESHYADEINKCTGEINTLEHELDSRRLEESRLKLEIEKIRQAAREEIQKTEWEYDDKIKEVERNRLSLDADIEKLQSLADSRKGSFCEWLENNVPGWQYTVGRVVDEETILYSQELSPRLSPDESKSLFGIELNLSGIERSLRTPEQINKELAGKKELRDKLFSQVSSLRQEKEDKNAAVTKRAASAVREHLDKQNAISAALLQIPVKIKNIKADLTTWYRKDDEWRRQQQEQTDVEILKAANLLKETKEDMEKLAADFQRRSKHINDEQEKSIREAERQYDEAVDIIKKDMETRRREMESDKAGLLKSQNDELKGRGADTEVINKCKARIDSISSELKYIEMNRHLVYEYEKDRREFFDHENEFKDLQREKNERLNDLDDKYRQRSDKLNKSLGESDTELKDKEHALEMLLGDLKSLEAFRSDAELCPPDSCTDEELETKKTCGAIIDELKGLMISGNKKSYEFKKSVNEFNSYFSPKNIFHFATVLMSDADYKDFASNLCEFVEENKIEEYKTRISERYADIISRISQETGSLTKNESEISKTIKAINNDFVERNFTGVIRSIELRHQASNDQLMQLLLEIQRFSSENAYNMGALNLFSQDSRADVNEKAVKYLYSFSRKLQDNPSRKNIVLSDTFNLQFRVVENDNDTGWVEKISNVGSDGTDILVKAMVNIMLINVFKEKASRKFGDFKIHCMMDEIGKLHPQNVKGILDFANCRNILLINSSPTTYNVEDYRYTYLLSKDKKSSTRVVPLLSRI